MSIVMKYLELGSILKTPVGEVLEDMDEMGAGTLSAMVTREDETPVGGIVLLRGGDVARYAGALEAVTAEIEREECGEPEIGAGVLEEIRTERRRQRAREELTPEYDDHLTDGSLADAAAAYCLATSTLAWGAGADPEEIWPWPEGFKPKDRRRDLVRAAALIVAEIERMDRAGAAGGEA